MRRRRELAEGMSFLAVIAPPHEFWVIIDTNLWPGFPYNSISTTRLTFMPNFSPVSTPKSSQGRWFTHLFSFCNNAKSELAVRPHPVFDTAMELAESDLRCE